MTESEIDLFERYLTDKLSADEKTSLAQRLDSNPEFQAAFVGYLEESQDLRVLLSQSTTKENIDAPSFSMAPSPSRRFQPVAASAAIGLLLGGLMTSAVWALAVSKVPEMTRLPVPLADPSFETTETPVPARMPRTLHQWVGDPSHVVSSGDSTVTPRQGDSMLRVGTVDSGRHTRIEQIVDVSHLVPDEDAVVEFSASFFYDGVDSCPMWLLMQAFTMDADEIIGTTGNLDDAASSNARRGVLLTESMNHWKKRRLRMDLPTGTKTIVFSIVAGSLPETSANASRYIDEAEARIVITPDEI